MTTYCDLNISKIVFGRISQSLLNSPISLRPCLDRQPLPISRLANIVVDVGMYAHLVNHMYVTATRGRVSKPSESILCLVYAAHVDVEERLAMCQRHS